MDNRLLFEGRGSSPCLTLRRPRSGRLEGSATRRNHPPPPAPEGQGQAGPRLRSRGGPSSRVACALGRHVRQRLSAERSSAGTAISCEPEAYGLRTGHGSGPAAAAHAPPLERTDMATDAKFGSHEARIIRIARLLLLLESRSNIRRSIVFLSRWSSIWPHQAYRRRYGCKYRQI